MLALLVVRRWRLGAVYAAAFVPALLTLAIWKYKGLGYLPLFGSGGTVHTAAGAIPLQTGLAAKSIHDYINIDWGHLGTNMAQIREFFWSMRLVEWLPFAGFVAVSRVSWTKAVFLGGWLGAFVLVKGASPRANVEDATFFRLLAPAWPAYLVLGAALPLLAPSVARRARRAVEAVSRPLALRARPVLASGALLGIVPLVVVATLPPLKDHSIVTDFDYNTVVPANVDFHLQASKHGNANFELTWREPPHGSTRIFYRVYRTQTYVGTYASLTKAVDGVACVQGQRGASTCRLFMEQLPPTAARRWTDHVKYFPQWTYRVAMLRTGSTIQGVATTSC